MIVDNWKTELEKNLPDVEKFLTAVLQEEAKISIESVDSTDKKEIAKLLNKEDVFIFSKDETHQSSIIIALDKEWFGLLSSIMMGVEEKENNEITRDLLKKFASEMSVTMIKSLRKNGLQVAVGDIEIFTLKQLEKELKHGEYFHTRLQVSGLADDNVRAELLLGNPDVRLSESDSDKKSSGKADSEEKQAKDSVEDSPDKKEKEIKKEEKSEDVKPQEDPDSGEADSQTPGSRDEKAGQTGDASEKLFTSMDTDTLEEAGGGMEVEEDQVISGRKVEFEGFEYSGKEESNGNTRSMALLKDVEMDVSVQLGQIEMPLGKVLQLAKGSIIELDKLAGEPVDILVNGSKIAQGEVVVIDEHFGVRITNLITTRERIAHLKKTK